MGGNRCYVLRSSNYTLASYCHFSVLHLSFVLSEFVPSSTSCLYTAAVASTFGTISFKIIHRFPESQGASLLGSHLSVVHMGRCAYPCPVTFAMCASQEQSFDITKVRIKIDLLAHFHVNLLQSFHTTVL